MAAILRAGRSFKPEVVPEVESNIKLAHSIPYILSFDQCSSLNINGVMAISKSDLLFNLVT